MQKRAVKEEWGREGGRVRKALDTDWWEVTDIAVVVRGGEPNPHIPMSPTTVHSTRQDPYKYMYTIQTYIQHVPIHMYLHPSQVCVHFKPTTIKLNFDFLRLGTK